jgi:hypothetical protein
VVTQGVTLAAIGVVAGVLGVGRSCPILTTQLYGIRPLDPPTMAGRAALLLVGRGAGRVTCRHAAR